MSNRGSGLVVFAILSVGCGGSAVPDARAAEAAEESDSAAPAEAAPPPSPRVTRGDGAPSSTQDEGDALGQAIADFDRAQLELSELLGRDLDPRLREAGASGGAAEPERSAPKAAAAPAPPAADKASRAEAAKPLKKGDDGCVNVCRAFDSLTRSAAAVCRLDEGERCRKANDVVAVAKDDAGVKACACKK